MLKRIALTNIIMFAALASVAAHSRTLVNDKITVAANNYVYYQFSVSKTTTIQGRFRAEGGSGNDIECFILDADGFENWSNGHRVNTWYNSGRVTVANISARLPEGTYYLVFSNKFSMFTNKVVTATAEVR